GGGGGPAPRVLCPGRGGAPAQPPAARPGRGTHLPGFAGAVRLCFVRPRRAARAGQEAARAGASGGLQRPPAGAFHRRPGPGRQPALPGALDRQGGGLDRGGAPALRVPAHPGQPARAAAGAALSRRPVAAPARAGAPADSCRRTGGGTTGSLLGWTHVWMGGHMATTQAQRGEAFRDLHYGKRLLVLANPWDAGSARLLAGLGFQALATTSADLSFSLGLRDGAGQVGWEQALANAAAIVDASGLPVTADLEQGYGATPEACWRIIRDAARAGLVGASIEDASGDPLAPILPLGQAVERVRAAAEAARALDFPFMLCARTENFMHGRADLDDTLHRQIG